MVLLYATNNIKFCYFYVKLKQTPKIIRKNGLNYILTEEDLTFGKKIICYIPFILK